MNAKAVRGAMVLLFWIAAALLVLAAHRVLDPNSAVAAATVKVVAIVGVAFVYMRVTARELTLDHALSVGVAWLLFNVVAELLTAKVLGHGWFELIGAPSSPWLRNLLMIAWIGAPAVFSRSEPVETTVAKVSEEPTAPAPPAVSPVIAPRAS
jgi:pheromone shutdown protein TraB